jgi:outer membrane immunogenic protein
MSWRTALIGLASAMSLAMPGTGAQAGDRVSIKDGPAPFSWTGFYVGVTAGAGWGESRFDDSGFKSNPFDIDGFVAGGTIGYNFQLSPRWVVGIETDLSFSNISGSFGPGNLGQPNGAFFGCSPGPCVTDVDWFGTVRARLGATFDRSLVYATGGLAYGKVKSSIVGGGFDSNDTNVGWTIGGGIEHAVSRNWSAKIEYLHVDLGWTGIGKDLKSDAQFDVVRAGLNYRFAP